MFEEIFKRKKLNSGKLIVYGFKACDTVSEFKTDILGGEFELTVAVDKQGEVNTVLIERATGEEYSLYKTNAVGAFVGSIRTAIESVLSDIAEKCYDTTVFKTKQAEEIINYVRGVFGDELEFLWTKFPDYAVMRRKDNEKWYGVIMSISGRKIGLNGDNPVEIIDLRMDPSDKEKILSNENYYPGWHMNKNSWYAVVLDGGVSTEELTQRIFDSYELAK